MSANEGDADRPVIVVGAGLKLLDGEDPFVEAKKRAAAIADWYEPAGEWLDDAPYGPPSGPPLPTGSKY